MGELLLTISRHNYGGMYRRIIAVGELLRSDVHHDTISRGSHRSQRFLCRSAPNLAAEAGSRARVKSFMRSQHPADGLRPSAGC